MKIALLFLLLLVSIHEVVAQDSSWQAPKSANDLKNPFKGIESATSEGKSMYNQMCTICHGRKGDGKGVGGVSLDPKPANFLSLKVENESDGAIFWKLTTGKPPMASYNDILSEDQRWKLVNYIRSLEKN
jgi:mono/diheme cytochrome c family protein